MEDEIINIQDLFFEVQKIAMDASISNKSLLQYMNSREDIEKLLNIIKTKIELISLAENEKRVLEAHGDY